MSHNTLHMHVTHDVWHMDDTWYIDVTYDIWKVTHARHMHDKYCTWSRRTQVTHTCPLHVSYYTCMTHACHVTHDMHAHETRHTWQTPQMYGTYMRYITPMTYITPPCNTSHMTTVAYRTPTCNTSYMTHVWHMYGGYTYDMHILYLSQMAHGCRVHVTCDTYITRHMTSHVTQFIWRTCYIRLM